MPNITIDGTQVAVEQGKTVIQACEQLGIEIPRYCYHPGLRVAGSCRMCLVEIEKMSKMQIACNTPAQEGMVIHTQSKNAKEARRSVLEFLLLNHPLDCPVCDRSGECDLQNYYMKYGLHTSRMYENKLKKKKAFPIGPYVILDQERCVLCSRCVRFTDEVSKTGELGIFNRGTWSEVNVYPGRELTNSYSGNVVDICPVGALLDRDFRYQVSVWYLKESPSVCPGCSTGCNIRLHYNLDRRYKVQGRRILRLKPRFNEDVNKYWMCDEGRYNYRWIDENRMLAPRIREQEPVDVEWDDLIQRMSDHLKKTIEEHGASSVAIVASAQMTNEELYLVRKIFFEHLQISTIPFYIAPPSDASEDDFLIRKDKNPNTKGAGWILFEQRENPVKGILDAAEKGKIQFLYVFHTNLFEHFPEAKVRSALKAVPTIAYHGTNVNKMTELSHYVVPAATYAEKEGTFTNHQGRVQRIFPAVAPLGSSRPTLEILRDLGRSLRVEVSSADASEIFAELAAHNSAFSGLDYDSIGHSGAPAEEQAAVAGD